MTKYLQNIWLSHQPQLHVVFIISKYLHNKLSIILAKHQLVNIVRMLAKLKAPPHRATSMAGDSTAHAAIVQAIIICTA